MLPRFTTCPKFSNSHAQIKDALSPQGELYRLQAQGRREKMKQRSHENGFVHEKGWDQHEQNSSADTVLWDSNSLSMRESASKYAYQELYKVHPCSQRRTIPSPTRWAGVVRGTRSAARGQNGGARQGQDRSPCTGTKSVQEVRNSACTSQKYTV